MQQPIQPQFKIRLFERGKQPSTGDSYKQRGGTFTSYGDSSFIDIESCVAYPVVFSAEASELNRLTFTIDKQADVIIQRLYLTQWVVLYGGSYSEGGSLTKVFSGTISRIRTQFPDSGAIKCTVECMSYGYNQLGKDTSNYFVYPDKNSTRKFAKGKEEISLKDLIKGIIEESEGVIGEISLPNSVANEKFTRTHIRYQKDTSDWKFLNDLAKSYGCTMWSEEINGVEKFFFVDRGKIYKTKDELQFIYPIRGKNGVGDIQPNEIQTFSDSSWNRPRIIRNVQVDEDIPAAYSVTRSAMFFDKETGEFKEAISEITEEQGRQVITLYTLDEARVAYIHKTDPELSEKIRNQGFDKFKWSSGCKDIKDETPQFARYYYKARTVVDETQAVFDQAYMGIKVTCECNMDLSIRTQRVYPIRGIMRYSSSDLTYYYHLMGLSHIWDKTGTRTELEFIR